MSKPTPMTPAQRQAKRRQKLITAARELEALKQTQSTTKPASPLASEIMALIESSPNQDLLLIKKLIERRRKDKTVPSYESLTAMYQTILKECIKKDVNDAIVVDIETLYIFSHQSF
jgi:hypothetical protein